jgi:Uma2 family endonuclease
MQSAIVTEVVPRMADWIARLGGIEPARIVMRPTPGSATEADLLHLLAQRRGLFELIDGTLVEKLMGYHESKVAMWIGHLLLQFLDRNNLGEVTGPDATMRLMPGLVRLPDVAFVRKEKAPKGDEAIPNLAPDLAVEVLSRSSTKSEMDLKTRAYFLAGTTLVWLVDLEKRCVIVHTGPDAFRVLDENEILDGGDVLPGLQLPVCRIFESLPAPAKKLK